MGGSPLAFGLGGVFSPSLEEAPFTPGSLEEEAGEGSGGGASSGAAAVPNSR